MTQIKDIAGQRFGKWTALRCAGARRRVVDGRCVASTAMWVCRCECGTEREVSGGHLRKGSSKSCGCDHAGRIAYGQKIVRHGHTIHHQQTPEYRAWLAMRKRCCDSTHFAFDRYGGRGIDVCPEWLASFEAFFSDMGPRPTPAHSLERVENNRGYSPDNCVWADKKTQNRNTRQNRLVTFRGKTQCVSAWAEELGLPYQRTWGMIRSGHPPEVAFREALEVV